MAWSSKGEYLVELRAHGLPVNNFHLELLQLVSQLK